MYAYLHSWYSEATGEKKKINKNPQSDFRRTREWLGLSRFWVSADVLAAAFRPVLPPNSPELGNCSTPCTPLSDPEYALQSTFTHTHALTYTIQP